MIYFLSGLLIIHGIVCLLGAFFPFYPPVYFFYVFFAGHFAVKLIIVLLVGAAQIVYGGYLLLKKRWQVRWYWLAMAVVISTGILLIFPAFHGLFTQIPTATPEPPPYPSVRPGTERPDDIIPTPGGPQYRANVHQEGLENPWPPIETKEVVLADDVRVTYRDYIETDAGEGRNNIVYVRVPGQDIGSANIEAVNAPAEIEVKRGIRWHGPGTIAQVLVIEISQGVQAGEYTFEIDVEVNGEDYGTISCMIEIKDDNQEAVLRPPSVITAKEPYTGNHGITTTRVAPQAGDKGILVAVNLLPLPLDELILKSDVIVIGKVVDILPAKQADTQSVRPTIYTDVVIEAKRYLYGQPSILHIAVRVPGGRVGDTVMRVDASPVFDLGEDVALFLSRMSADNIPPDRIEPVDYYSVTGYNQGKRQYGNGVMVDLGGISVLELEQKIASIHGDE